MSWYKRFKRVQRGTLQKPAWWTVEANEESSKNGANCGDQIMMDDSDNNSEQTGTDNTSPGMWVNCCNSYYPTNSKVDHCPDTLAVPNNYYFSSPSPQDNIQAQSAAVVTERGVVYGVGVPNPLNVKFQLQDAKETQTSDSRYRNGVSFNPS